MRIHSDSVDALEIRKAARLAGVGFTRFNLHGSRTRKAAFDIILTGNSPRNQNGGDEKAATYSEWGHFLNTLYTLDPDLVTPYYENADHFHWATGDRYRGGFDLSTQHRSHKWEFSGEAVTGSYMVHECKCGEIRRFLHGRKFADLAG
jgi:hypothetical protein